MLANLIKLKIKPAGIRRVMRGFCSLSPKDRFLKNLAEVNPEEGFYYYRLLGLDRTASEEEIKQQFVVVSKNL